MDDRLCQTQSWYRGTRRTPIIKTPRCQSTRQTQDKKLQSERRTQSGFVWKISRRENLMEKENRTLILRLKSQQFCKKVCMNFLRTPLPQASSDKRRPNHTYSKKKPVPPLDYSVPGFKFFVLLLNAMTGEELNEVTGNSSFSHPAYTPDIKLSTPSPPNAFIWQQ